MRPEATNVHACVLSLSKDVPSVPFDKLRARLIQPRVDLDRDREAFGVLHLGGDGAHPDELVQPELVTGEPGLGRGQEGFAGRPDRLVRLLGVLDLAGVDAGLVGQVGGAEQLPDLVARGGDRGLRQRHRVGSHIGDEAGLVEVLGHRHRPLGGEAELAAGLLLQRRGPERRVRAARVGLGLDAVDRERGGFQRAGQGPGLGLVQVQHRIGAAADQGAVAGEIAALGHSALADPGQSGREQRRLGTLAGIQHGVEIPVARGPEGDPLTLPVDHQPGGDRLHAAGRKPGHDLLPEHRGDLVAVQPVEDAAGLLGVDQVLVEIARIGDRLGDRALGDLVEHHPMGRDLGLQFLQQMPGDRLALAVAVGGQQEFVGLGQRILQGAQRRPLVGVDHVEGFEAVVHVDPGAGPLLTLVLGGHLGGTGRQVADVASTGLDDVSVAQEAGDLGRFGRRLDDHESPATFFRGHGPPLSTH